MKKASISLILEKAHNIFKYITCSIIFIMMILIVGDAIGRALKYPVPGAVEINEEYFMVAIVFLSLGFTYREGRHIKVELIQHLIPRISCPAFKALTETVAIFYFGLIAYEGARQTAYAFGIDQRSTSELGYPLAPAYFLVVMGSVWLCLWVARDLTSTVIRAKRTGWFKYEGEAR